MKAIKPTLSAVLMVLSQLVFAQTGSWKLAGNSLTGTEKFGSKNSVPVNFITNNTQRMTLTATGNLGIGVTSPKGKLHIFSGNSGVTTPTSGSTLIVESNSANVISLLNPANSTSGIFFGNTLNSADGGITYNDGIVQRGLVFRAAGSPHMILSSNGNLGINAFSPASELHIFHSDGNSHGLRIQNSQASANSWTVFEFNDGDLGLASNNSNKGFFDNTSGSYFTLSDARSKKDIEAAPSVLEKVMQLHVKKYHFLTNQTSDKKHYGMIAQDVEKIFPEIVSYKLNKDQDLYSVNYSAYGVLAIKAIQEQQKKIEEQERTNQEQQQKIITLEDRIAKLEALNNGGASSTGSSNNIVSKEISGVTLEQNQPNPFNQATTIHYQLPKSSAGQINVYDINGTLVKTIKADESGQALINGSDLKAGTYSYTLVVNGKMAVSKKLVLIK